jgi:hypothetical protein
MLCYKKGWVLAACLFYACTPSVPVEVSPAQATGPRLTLRLVNAKAQEILLRDGASFKLYKQETLLQTAQVVDNFVQMQAVQVAPPYQFRLENLISEGLVSDRGVPLDTQGGLRSADPIPFPVPPSALPVDMLPRVPSAAPETKSLSGEIRADLRENKPLTLDLTWPE